MLDEQEQQEQPAYHTVTRDYTVKLIKNTKGHNWEITVRADTAEEVMRETLKIDKELTAEFGK